MGILRKNKAPRTIYINMYQAVILDLLRKMNHPAPVFVIHDHYKERVADEGYPSMSYAQLQKALRLLVEAGVVRYVGDAQVVGEKKLHPAFAISPKSDVVLRLALA